MAIKTKAPVATVISIHREPEPNSFLNFFIPNVHPGTYQIPGLETPEKEMQERCTFSFPNQEPFHYASTEIAPDGRKYVKVLVRDPKTIITSTGEQKVDEFGQPLFPDVQRFRMDVAPEEVANEIEKVYGQMGILAIEGTEPTPEELDEVEKNRINWMFRVIQETNKWYKRLGEGQVTDQARRIAHELHVAHMLTPLPEWATLNPSGRAKADTFNCKGCGTVLPNNIVSCLNCHVIYDWKLAVDLGLVKPTDVPPSKRVEAGIDTVTPAAIDSPPTPEEEQETLSVQDLQTQNSQE